jgi:UDP-galactopyranose mutase
MKHYEGLKYLVVGSGFFGTVMAERIASVCNERVVVIEKRSHIGGNSFSEIDSATGIECHKYGSHIFHTNNLKVWNYINRFTEFNPYQHKVLTEHNGHVYPMPIGLMTINSFFGLCLKPFEADEFFHSEIAQAGITNPINLEEKAISLIGERLYNAFIKGYTQKQWGREPRELPPDIITRLPVRSSYNINYFNDPWQGIPLGGYHKLFERMLSHSNIEVQLNTDYFLIRDQIPADCIVVFTGMVDQLFDYQYGKLDWRGLHFEWETVQVSDYQGTAVMNYADPEIPFTRIHEFKHYHPERIEAFSSLQSVICREYPKTYQQGEEAYYPVNNSENQQKYDLYAVEAAKHPNLILGGRLGAYKYWDMDKAIENALLCFEKHFNN